MRNNANMKTRTKTGIHMQNFYHFFSKLRRLMPEKLLLIFYFAISRLPLKTYTLFGENVYEHGCTLCRPVPNVANFIASL